MQYKLQNWFLAFVANLLCNSKIYAALPKMICLEMCPEL